ncbi:hypothetical protein V1521DRAFT_7877 [Lipomyces starkeyi]
MWAFVVDYAIQFHVVFRLLDTTQIPASTVAVGLLVVSYWNLDSFCLSFLYPIGISLMLHCLLALERRFRVDFSLKRAVALLI